MKRILISEVEDGMILAEPVCGNSGQIILQHGSTLTQSLAHRIAARGIQHVVIEGNTEETEIAQETIETDPSPENNIQKKVNAIFEHCDQTEIMKMLVEWYMKYGTHTITELKRLSNNYESLNTKVNSLMIKVAGLAATLSIIVALIFKYGVK